jgi:two-component system, NtrC family, response regulator HydG
MKDEDTRPVARRPKVIVLEAESDARQGLVRILHALGADTFTAGNGRQGLKLLMKNPADLVLVDMDLPDISKTGVFRRIMERAHPVRVALMVQWRNRWQFEWTMEHGAFTYLRKPVREQEIVRLFWVLKTLPDFDEKRVRLVGHGACSWVLPGVSGGEETRNPNMRRGAAGLTGEMPETTLKL